MSLTTHRLAVAAAFATQAFVFITLTTRLPTAAESWHLSTTELSLVLLMMVLLAGAGSVLAEQVAVRRSSAAALRAGLVLAALAVPVVVLSDVPSVGMGAMAIYGLGLGMVDAATNMQAVALEHRYGRPILPSFHGAWTLGGVLGALLALTTGSAPDAVPAAVAVLPALVALAPFLPGRAEAAADLDSRVPWRPILLVGVAMALFYTVDVATQTWGAAYAHEVFGTARGASAAGVFAYLLASGTVRLAGDRLVAAYGAVRVLRVGAVIGAAGLALVVGAPSWPFALAGFAVTGGGLAVVAPLSFSAAALLTSRSVADPAAARAQVDAVIARFNLFNYAGALLGSVMTGLVGGSDLRYGFALPAVLVLALWPLARAFVPRDQVSVVPR